MLRFSDPTLPTGCYSNCMQTGSNYVIHLHSACIIATRQIINFVPDVIPKIAIGTCAKSELQIVKSLTVP